MRLGIAGFAAVMAALLFFVHKTPLYGVETDLFGEAIPAMRGLVTGHVDADLFAYKGPGYPLLLALFSMLSGGDAWIGARLLNLVAAVVGAWATWRLLARALGPTRGAFATLLLCANPLYFRSTYEVGTDVPTFAVAVTATALFLEATGPGTAALAGLLAGFATIMRYNAGFLLPAGVLALLLAPAPGAARARRVAAFALAAAVPLVPWLVWNFRLHGAALANRNYANLAFELYANGMGWDPFWQNVAPRFHSFGDVIGYDPSGAARHLGQNLAVRWRRDLRELVPVWIGLMAVVGAIVHAPRARRHVAWIVCYALCYATLALVFYSPRFFLYLVPFYLGAAALCVFPGPAWARPARLPLMGLGLAALVASALTCRRELAELVPQEPIEMREAGAFLHGVRVPGDRVLSRKPQVAYFADMDFGPLPETETIESLLAAARAAHAHYLYLSGIEYGLRPQFRILKQPELHLPGLTPVFTDAPAPGHYGTVFRVDPAGPADAAFRDSMVTALDLFYPRATGSPDGLSYLGALYFNEHEYGKSLACLDEAIALAPQLLTPRAYRAVVLGEIGRLDDAATDCELVIAHAPGPQSASLMLLGSIRARQGRLPEAKTAFEAAARIETATPAVQLDVAALRLATGDAAGAEQALARAVQLAPALAPVAAAARSAGARGDTRSLVRLAAAAQRSFADDAIPVESLADSVAAGAFGATPGATTRK